MRALLPTYRTITPHSATALADESTSNSDLLQPLAELAEKSNYLIAGTAGEFVVEDAQYSIPRFIFMGDKGGGDTIRLGIFAGLRGDEPEGVESLVKFLLDLERRPSLAKNYHIYVYPIANPSAFAAKTQNNASGHSLVSQFWQGSSQPEVYYLERELGVVQFHGIISLRGQSESRRFHAQMPRPTLIASLAEPAEQTANRWFPENSGSFPRKEPSSAFFTTTDELKVTPFEIIFQYPRVTSRYNQISSINAALISVLESYRGISSFGQNI
jgi:hypothetical protein